MRDVGDKALSILLLEPIGALEFARGRLPRAIQILVPV